MSDTLTDYGYAAVSLGGFVFQDFEVPEVIRWGGKQALTVHKLIGGTRVIDAMGRDDADISWSGILLSADASDRADELDQLRIGGEIQELIFAGRDYLVIVRDFQADQRKINHVPYRIACTVLQDQSAPVSPPDEDSLDVVNGDVGAVMLMPPPPPPLVPVQTTLATVQATLAATTVLEAATATTNSVVAGVASAEATAIAARTASDAVLATTAATAATTGALVGAIGNAGATLTAMTAVSAAAEQSAMAAVMIGYLARTSANLASV